MYDVAIIGGGLAGLALSITLNRKGHQVVLIEKERYPFHKVCGEYISREAEKYLNWLGADLENNGAQIIDRFKMTHYKGPMLETHLPLGGIGISRHRLDSTLAKQAEAEGVTIKQGVKALELRENEVVTADEIIPAKVVIGAQGKRSNIDRSLNRDFMHKPMKGRDHFIGVKYHVKADLPIDLIELHIFPDGYAGISAVEDDRYCLCYLTKAHHLDEHGSISAMEQHVLHQNPILSGYLERFESFYDKPKVIAQINFQNKEKHVGKHLFAGDAAGLIAPLSGNGMSMALHSAHLLCEALDQYLKGEKSLQKAQDTYQRQWQATLGKRFRTAGLLQGVFFQPILMTGLMKTANFFPFLKQQIIKQTHGKPFFKE